MTRKAEHSANGLCKEALRLRTSWRSTTAAGEGYSHRATPSFALREAAATGRRARVRRVRRCDGRRRRQLLAQARLCRHRAKRAAEAARAGRRSLPSQERGHATLRCRDCFRLARMRRRQPRRSQIRARAPCRDPALERGRVDTRHGEGLRARVRTDSACDGLRLTGESGIALRCLGGRTDAARPCVSEVGREPGRSLTR